MTVPTRLGVFGALATMAVVGSGCNGSGDTGGVIDVDVSLPELSLPELSLPVITLADGAVPDLSVPPLTAASTTPDPTTAATTALFVAPNGDYTIEFPDAPARSDLPVDLFGEVVVADAYLYEDGSDAVYFTSVFDYPDSLGDTPAEVVLEGARDGAVANVGGVVESSSFVERSGVAGIEFTFTIDVPAAGVGTALVLFDDPRLYQSFALGTPEGAADYRRFVDTFQFTASSSPEADQ